MIWIRKLIFQPHRTDAMAKGSEGDIEVLAEKGAIITLVGHACRHHPIMERKVGVASSS